MRPHDRLLEWFKFKGRDQAFDAVFSADAELDDVWGVHPLRDSLWTGRTGHRYEDVRTLLAQGDDGGGTVVLEASDTYTGTWHRIAWVFSVRDGLITKVTETLSAPFNREDVDKSNEGLEAEQLTVEFKLRRITKANRAGYQAAVRAVLASVHESHPDWPPPEKCGFFGAHAFEANSWWFVPFGWIGCSGHIVEKASGRVTELGSEFPLRLCFWAHERGALQSPCTLVIDKMYDVARAHDLLARPDDMGPHNCVLLRDYAADGSRRWLSLAALVGKDSLKIEVQSLWFVLPALKEAETTHVFDFRIEKVAAS